MALVFVECFSLNPIRDWKLRQVLAEYDPDQYTPIFLHKEPERFHSSPCEPVTKE